MPFAFTLIDYNTWESFADETLYQVTYELQEQFITIDENGKRNFETDDQSTNNMWVGLFVFGEGYQNNHHKYPKRAKFSINWNEIDMGYGLSLVAEKLGLLKINR